MHTIIVGYDCYRDLVTKGGMDLDKVLEIWNYAAKLSPQIQEYLSKVESLH